MKAVQSFKYSYSKVTKSYFSLECKEKSSEAGKLTLADQKPFFYFDYNKNVISFNKSVIELLKSTIFFIS